MNTLIAEIIGQLQDSRKSYQEAAARAQDPAVKQQLDELSLGRNQLVDDLARASGADPAGIGAGKTPHPVWNDVRSTPAAPESTDFYHLCEQGETVLAERYQLALDEPDISDSLKTLLDKQRQEVLANLSALVSMRRMLERSGTWDEEQ